MRLPKPATTGHAGCGRCGRASHERTAAILSLTEAPDHAAACATRGGAASHSQPTRSRASAPAAWRRRGAGRPAHLLVDAAPAPVPCCTQTSACRRGGPQPCPPAHAGPRRAVPRPRPLAPQPRAASSPSAAARSRLARRLSAFLLTRVTLMYYMHYVVTVRTRPQNRSASTADPTLIGSLTVLALPVTATRDRAYSVTRHTICTLITHDSTCSASLQISVFRVQPLSTVLGENARAGQSRKSRCEA
jgi:hypothetical protein